MANQIPLSTVSDAAGAVLVPESYGSTLIDGIRRESAVASLARVERFVGNQRKYNIYAGRPTVDFVEELDDKPVTGAEFSELTINVKKIATTLLYSSEILADAAEDPRVLVNADVASAFADAIDAHCLGYAAGAAITGKFDAELTGTSQSAELGTTGDAFAKAVSDAMEQVEASGYRPTAIVAASDVRAHLRDSRYTVETTVPVYGPGFEREPDTLYGLPVVYTSNLDAFPAGAGKVAAVVGDFSQAIVGMREDLTVRTSTEATVNVGGTPRSLWQSNSLGVLYEMRLGMNIHDLNGAFCKITNAS